MRALLFAMFAAANAYSATHAFAVDEPQSIDFFVGTHNRKVLSVREDGVVMYQGRKLGSDKAIFKALGEFLKGNSCGCQSPVKKH